ncbi:MAG: dihydrolipoyl dehydrogenase [Rhodanobacter sp.]
MSATRRIETCDVAVIGAGTAGLVAEKHARDRGASTRLIDIAFSGTTCASVGCMPSKLLIAAADAAQAVRDAAQLGINATPQVNGVAVMQRLRRYRDAFVQGVADSFAQLPAGTFVQGRARFIAPGQLLLDDGTRIDARAVVVATGSAPALPQAFQAVERLVLTNQNIFELHDLPASVGVIGSGPIGLELAQALARLGVRVAVFDRGDRLAGLPAKVSAELQRVLAAELPIHLGQSPRAQYASDQRECVRLSWDGGSAQFDRLLVAAGRPPQLAALDLQNAGLVLDARGMPDIDPATLQCADAPVFIAGDANGLHPFLHEAADDGAVAGRNAASYPNLFRANRSAPLAITFCRPAAAVVGKLPQAGDTDTVTGCADYARQGRAKVIGKAHGICEIHAARPDGKLTGAALCIPGGEHIAQQLAWAIADNLTAAQMLDRPFYHPTLEEGLRTALRQICRQVSVPVPWNHTDLPLPGGDSERSGAA